MGAEQLLGKVACPRPHIWEAAEPGVSDPLEACFLNLLTVRCTASHLCQNCTFPSILYVPLFIF